MAELIDLINASLPQYQCGRCDTPGCKPYAQSIVDGAPHNRCVPGGLDTLNKLERLTKRATLPLDHDYGPTLPNQIARVVEEECIGCKKCITACPVDAIIGAANLMHSVIDDICTGCELCIEPCPVDCIEIVEVAIYDIDQPRKISQSFYNLKENLNLNSERSKIKNLSDENMNISNSINTQISNRKIDKQIGLKEMQHKIAKADLEKLHNYDQLEIDKFINKGLKK